VMVMAKGDLRNADVKLPSRFGQHKGKDEKIRKLERPAHKTSANARAAGVQFSGVAMNPHFEPALCQAAAGNPT